MEALRQQVLQHELKLLLRRVRRHGRGNFVQVWSREVSDPARAGDLVRRHPVGLLQQVDHRDVRIPYAAGVVELRSRQTGRGARRVIAALWRD